ncbi:MAG: PAS domain-containing sensor histidine kinase [Bacteroidota bacterium]
MERRFPKNERRFIKTLDALADGIYEYDFRTKETFVSPNFYRILGYEPNAFVVTDEKWDSMVHPKDLDEANQLFYDHINNLTPRYKAEYRMQCKDGTYRWMSCTGKIIEYEDGEAVRMIGALSSIHDRKQLELGMHDVLKASNTLRGIDFFRYLAESLADLLNIDYVVVSTLEQGVQNDFLKALVMWEKDHFQKAFTYDILGTPCELIYEQKDIVFIGEDLQARFPDYTYLKENNIQCYYGIPFKDIGGNLIGHLFVMHQKPLAIDSWMQPIVELYAQTVGAEVERLRNENKLNELNESLEEAVVQRTQQLEDAIEELDAFFYKASHDLRAPITTIEGIYNLLQNELKASEREELMNMLGGQIGTIQSLNQSINEVGTIRKHDPDFKSFDLARLISGLIKKLNLPQWCLCHFNIAEDTMINSDRYLLEVILTSFISNCIKYQDRSKEGNCITISYETAPTPHLNIEDNGIGIPETLQHNHFKMFFRANVELSGYGLGLYKAKLAADKLDIKLALKSQEGKGSVASIYFKP